MSRASPSDPSGPGRLGTTTVGLAIVDSGIDPNNPRVGPVQGGVRIRASVHGDVQFDDDWQDRNGHGTACASVVRRIAPRVNLYAIRVSGDDALSSLRLITAAIRWAARFGVDIINVSLGSRGQLGLADLKAACQRAVESDVLIVAAESNDGEVVYPANLQSVIAVGGAATRGLLHYFRDPVCPRRFLGHAERQRVAWKDGEQAFLGGTSLAAAQIAALAARIRQSHPGATVPEVIERLTANGEAYGSIPSAPDGRGELSNAALVPRAQSVAPSAVAFPYSKEIQALVRFPDLARPRIQAIMDVLGNRQVGRDAGESILSARTGIPVLNRDPALLAESELLILGHTARVGRLRREEYAGPLLVSALEYGRDVFSLDPLDDFPALTSEARQRGLRWDWPQYCTDREFLEECRRTADFPVETPVLGVFGTRSGQGKFTTQLALRRRLVQAGYRIGHLSTEPHGVLLDCDVVFHMGHDARVPLDYVQWIPYLRHAILAIEAHREPDLILVGSQSGTIPRDPHLQVPFLCLNSLLFLYGTRPDAVFLVVESTLDSEEVAYTRETIAALGSLGKAEVLGLFYSQRIAESVEVRHRRARRWRLLERPECERLGRQLEEVYSLPAFTPLIETDLERAYRRLLDFFGER